MRRLCCAFLVLLFVVISASAQTPQETPKSGPMLTYRPLNAVTSAFSPGKNRIVQWHEPPISDRNTKSTTGKEVVSQIDVLEISDVTIDKKPIKLGQSFAADDNWLDKLTFRIKNVSSVELSKVQMNLFLPEIMPGGPLVAFCYGCGPTLERSIAPDQEVEMKVVFYSWVAEQINKQSSLAAITKAEINDVTVTAADGKSWLSGCVRAVDPKNACPVK